jgi:hypothetical protein
MHEDEAIDCAAARRQYEQTVDRLKLDQLDGPGSGEGVLADLGVGGYIRQCSQTIGFVHQPFVEIASEVFSRGVVRCL